MSLTERLVEAFYWFMVFRAFVLIIDYTRGFEYEIPYKIIIHEDKEREE